VVEELGQFEAKMATMATIVMFHADEEAHKHTSTQAHPFSPTLVPPYRTIYPSYEVQSTEYGVCMYIYVV